MSKLLAGVMRHPPIHILDEELGRGNLPDLIVREVARVYGNDVYVKVVKVRFENLIEKGYESNYLFFWAPGIASERHYRFRITGGGAFYKLEKAEVPRPARKYY